MSYNEISVTVRKARKQHPCEWCIQKIEIGEEHFLRVYTFEGEFTTGRMHNVCFAAMEKSDHATVSEGWPTGAFRKGQII
jgi:hypothetical protein